MRRLPLKRDCNPQWVGRNEATGYKPVLLGASFGCPLFIFTEDHALKAISEFGNPLSELAQWHRRDVTMSLRSSLVELNYCRMLGAPKRVVVWSTAWLVLTATYFAFYYDAPSGFLGSLLGWALFAAGIPIVFSAMIFGTRRNPRWFAIALLVSAVAVLGWFTPLGRTLGARFKLLREKNHYESIVEQVAAGADGSEFGYPITVDAGPPPRVAFSWGGMLDNWRGIVHDPSGAVMKANILKADWSNRDDPDYASVSRLFGGTLVRAQHLEGDWYLCWFT